MQTKRTDFELGLDQATRRLDKAQRMLETIREMVKAGEMEKAYAISFDLEHETERLTLLTRVLPSYTGHPNAMAMMEDMVMNTVPVKLGFTHEGWFAAFIPALLPKKNNGSAEYIGNILYPAMRRFMHGKEPIRYPNCVLAFRHVYDRKRPERQYRDHDNIEVNMVADIIALYMMKDDSAMQCFHYYSSVPGDDERTEVYVIPQSEFPQWVEAEKSFPDKGAELLENRP